MPGKRRSPAQLARDRRRISDLYLQGWIQVDIAAEVGASQSTVSNDLKAIQKEWLVSSLHDFDEAKARELARIDRVEREAWAAWERSQLDAETVTEEVASDSAKKRAKRQTKTEGRDGDSAFLTRVGWCIEQRCKILGLYSPIKADVTSGGEPLTFEVVYVNPPPPLDADDES